MYETVFTCTVHDNYERLKKKLYLEQTLVPLFPPSTDPVVSVTPGDPEHIRIDVIWAEKEQCASFISGAAFQEWKEQAEDDGVRLRGPFGAERPGQADAAASRAGF